MVTTEKPYKVVGTRPIRPDGTDKVTGRANYGADIRLPGMLHGRVKRSPIAHGRIKRIDASKALALPGVRAVMTAEDLPRKGRREFAPLGSVKVSLATLSGNVMARDKVRYEGHAVAAVCATDPHIAEDALDLIEVEYEELPTVLEAGEAMLASAPLIDEELHTREMATGESAAEPSNVAMHFVAEMGNVEAGFAEAEIVLERSFKTKMVHQGYIEPHNATAFWRHDGGLEIWCSTQATFVMRDHLAGLLEHPVSKIRVTPQEIGGGFGGKISVYLEPLAAVLSRKTGKPVKMTLTRDEVFRATGPTSGTAIRVKLGAKRDGTLVAGEGELVYEAGAFPGSPVAAGVRCIFNAYAIPNQRIDGYDVLVNKPKVQPYRAPGAPAACFAMDSVMDELAERLELDPIELRLKNAAVEGTRSADGAAFGVIGNRDCLQAIRNSPHYRSELQGPNRGRGVAHGYWYNAGLESSAYASVNSDGTVALVLGSPDIGGTRASIAMQLAETLGIPADRVIPQVVDTDSVGFTSVTGGSRTAFAGGWAAHEAGLDLRQQLAARAAKIWGVEAGQARYRDDAVIVGPAGEDGGERAITFTELAAKLASTGGMIVGRADSNHASAAPTFATHIVDVEVDPETGKVEILRYTAAQDVGTAIHPSYVEGQIQGGVSQGVGWALNEEYRFDETGRMENASFLDYRIPTALDLPMIETVLVEVPNPGHPYGVRGVGEVPIVPPLAAVANAVHAATGHRFTELPISPAAVLEKLLPGEE